MRPPRKRASRGCPLARKSSKSARGAKPSKPSKSSKAAKGSKGSKDSKQTTGKAGGRSARPQRKKVCHFCKEKLDFVDFKDLSLLRKFVSERGKIRARRVTGTCSQHQRRVATAVKNAREVALLPYVVR